MLYPLSYEGGMRSPLRLPGLAVINRAGGGSRVHVPKPADHPRRHVNGATMGAWAIWGRLSWSSSWARWRCPWPWSWRSSWWCAGVDSFTRSAVPMCTARESAFSNLRLLEGRVQDHLLRGRDVR